MAIETNGTPVVFGTNDGGFGNMGIFGFLIIALLLMGNGCLGNWGNNGFANAIGYSNLATQNDVQRGFDNQTTIGNQREILSAVTAGTAQSVAAVNQSFHDTLAVVSDKYDELQRDNAELRVGQANMLAKQNECCCNTLRAIDGVNYSNALNTAAIKENTTAQAQKILDAIAQNKTEEMQNRINQLELAQAMAGVVRYPNGMTYNAGASPFCNCGNFGFVA